MAKKSKPKKSPAPTAAAHKHPLLVAAEASFEQGNFAAVQGLAARAGADAGIDGDVRAALLSLRDTARTDKITWLVGGAALLIALVVALGTLG